MNEFLFAFISCVNDEAVYARCIQAIGQLHVPPGYAIEIIPVYGAKSMTSGYQGAMKHSTAKYKVYLHQDTFIIHPDFITEVLQLFHQHPTVGMIGVMGTKTMPASGTWWEGTQLHTKFVSLIQNECSLQAINEIHAGYETVQGIDGAIMITQVDLDWDLTVADYHFYDASQSIRFNLHGLHVIVPAQPRPWILHYREHETDQAAYERCRLQFVARYAPFLGPA